MHQNKKLIKSHNHECSSSKDRHNSDGIKSEKYKLRIKVDRKSNYGIPWNSGILKSTSAETIYHPKATKQPNTSLSISQTELSPLIDGHTNRICAGGKLTNDSPKPENVVTKCRGNTDVAPKMSSEKNNNKPNGSKNKIINRKNEPNIDALAKAESLACDEKQIQKAKPDIQAVVAVEKENPQNKLSVAMKRSEINLNLEIIKRRISQDINILKNEPPPPFSPEEKVPKSCISRVGFKLVESTNCKRIRNSRYGDRSRRRYSHLRRVSKHLLPTARISKQFHHMDTITKKPGLVQLMYLIGLVLYTAVGGVLFSCLDSDAGTAAILAHDSRCLAVMNRELNNLSLICANLTYADCQANVQLAMHNLDQCHKNCSEINNCTKPPSLPMSDAVNAIAFASQTYTTVGYGAVYPTTASCRVISVIYTFIGIPYFLAFLQSNGHLLQGIFIRFWKFCRRKIEARIFQHRKCAAAPSAIAISGGLALDAPEHIKYLHNHWCAFLFVCLLTMLYQSISALFLSLMTLGQLSFWESLYVVLQTVSLVGLGDLLPSDPHTIFYHHVVFMIIGMILLSTLFFIFQDNLMSEMDKAIDKIFERIYENDSQKK